MTGFFKDFQFAVRQLRQRPAFTAIAIVVLALGLGANAAIFSVVHAVLLEPLPYPHGETLVEVFERDVIGNTEDDHYNPVSPGSFADWTRAARSVSALSAVRQTAFNISSKSQSFTPQRVHGIACSSNFLSILGVSPALGRFFQPSEDAPNSPYVAVLSYPFWQSHFGGTRDIVGRQVHLDGNSYTVLGAFPALLLFPGRPLTFWFRSTVASIPVIAALIAIIYFR